MAKTVEIRPMSSGDHEEVASLIYESTNAWYESHGHPPIFAGGSDSTRLFCEVYEAIDPGCCLLAVDVKDGVIAGSCFYHPRETHVSLGIMNVRSDYFGCGIARRLLKQITDFADERGLATRLVSSAMNLDSYSLYTRSGFVPRAVYQDMYLDVPESGLAGEPPEGSQRVRNAVMDDLTEIVELEQAVQSICRPDDYRHFLENPDGLWHVKVIEGKNGGIDGVLVSVCHPACTMLGPGGAKSQTDAAALIYAQLNHLRGKRPVWLVPVTSDALVGELYRWGARNCEIHFAQVRGEWAEPQGVVMPTFMPETG